MPPYPVPVLPCFSLKGNHEKRNEPCVAERLRFKCTPSPYVLFTLSTNNTFTVLQEVTPVSHIPSGRGCFISGQKCTAVVYSSHFFSERIVSDS